MRKAPATLSLPCPNCGGSVELTIEHRDRVEVERWIAGVERLREQGEQPAASSEDLMEQIVGMLQGPEFDRKRLELVLGYVELVRRADFFGFLVYTKLVSFWLDEDRGDA